MPTDLAKSKSSLDAAPETRLFRNWDAKCLRRDREASQAGDFAVSGVGALAPTLAFGEPGALAPEVPNGNRKTFLAYILILTISLTLLAIPPLKAQQTDHAKQLGMKLMCICGCGQVLVQCNHIGCPSSVPMLKELDAHIARAESDDLIVQDFVQEYGVQVLSAPPHTGFNAIAWFLPGIAFAIGLSLVILVIAQWRKRKIAAPAQPASGVSPEMLARARELADRATED